jgi:outer membrane protein assembly factor BamB
MQETIALSLEALAVGRDPIRWRARRAGANCASPLLLGEKLFLISDMGIAVCLEAKTGQVLVRKRLQGFYMASPIASGGHVYFTNTSGCTTLLGADSQMEKAAINELGENVIASPACADGHLYMRTIGTLYRIGPAAP